ncbi:MAG: DUF2853 family protein [Chitinophagales bacterium]|nr:DUF2853 family protein [Chitinophagales bacterium]
MSKFIEAVDASQKQLEKLGVKVDRALLEKIAKGLGPSLYKQDAALVACGQATELERIKKNFLIKKLELADTAKTEEGLTAVCEQMKSERMKKRPAFYYLLVKHFRKSKVYA